MGKGDETRQRIIHHAFCRATRDGLEGLSIGSLATQLELSKSGLFAHFGSKEELQVAVLEEAKCRFQTAVLRPALAAERGEPRLRVLLENWLVWLEHPDLPGGCLFMAASTELDDREGRPRDFLVDSLRAMTDFVSGTARHAVDAGQFRTDLDCDQLAFELYAILLGYHFTRRLIRDPRAEQRARAAIERLLAAARP